MIARSPVEAAFAAHGYGLVLKDIARVEMGAASRPGLPTAPAFISEIGMIAVKESPHVEPLE